MAASALRVATLMLALAGAALAAPDPRNAPASSWDIRLGSPGDPGEPFEMTGVVRDAGGDPVRGRKVFVYHADTKGAYAEGDGPMRFAGTLRTDPEGRYRVLTVFPGGYGGFAAHVHFEILEPARVAGFLDVRQEGSRGNGFTAKRGRDGVWRLRVDLRPGWSSPYGVPAGAGGSGYSRPMRQLAPELWKPPKHDSTKSEQP